MWPKRQQRQKHWGDLLKVCLCLLLKTWHTVVAGHGGGKLELTWVFPPAGYLSWRQKGPCICWGRKVIKGPIQTWTLHATIPTWPAGCTLQCNGSMAVTGVTKSNWIGGGLWLQQSWPEAHSYESHQPREEVIISFLNGHSIKPAAYLKCSCSLHWLTLLSSWPEKLLQWAVVHEETHSWWV